MNFDEIENLRKINSQESYEDKLPVKFSRTSLILQETHLEKLKALSWWERIAIKDILEEILSHSLSSITTSPIVKESIISLPSGWVKTTAVLHEDHLHKLKTLALVKRTTIRDLLYHILEDFFSSRKIRPIPKEKRKLIE